MPPFSKATLSTEDPRLTLSIQVPVLVLAAGHRPHGPKGPPHAPRPPLSVPHPAGRDVPQLHAQLSGLLLEGHQNDPRGAVGGGARRPGRRSEATGYDTAKQTGWSQ